MTWGKIIVPLVEYIPATFPPPRTISGRNEEYFGKLSQGSKTWPFTPSPHYVIFGWKKGVFQKLFQLSETTAP